MTDEDLLHGRPGATFGSGIIGVCDICGRRQAVIVLQKERYKLCVLDFLNKSWTGVKKTPGAPLPLYRSERVWFPTRAVPGGRAPAIVLSPTRIVKHPVVLVTPDIYGLTTTVLDAAIRFAREGFEVLVPDLGRTPGFGPSTHLSLRLAVRTRGGVTSASRGVASLIELFRDGLRFVKTRDLADPTRSAVFGESYGGSFAVLVAAQEPSLTALAVAYPQPVRPVASLGALGVPIFVVVAGADAASGRFLRDLRSLPVGPIVPEVLEIPGARHHFLARDLNVYDVGSAEAAWGAVVAFLRGQLLPPPPRPPVPPAARPAVPPAPPPSVPSGRTANAPAPAPGGPAPA